MNTREDTYYLLCARGNGKNRLCLLYCAADLYISGEITFEQLQEILTILEEGI